MAPEQQNESLLTKLLRCRITSWGFIFLKTTELCQKLPVQRKPCKYFSATPSPYPFSPSAGVLPGLGSSATSKAPLGITGHCPASLQHPQPGDVKKVHGKIVARPLNRKGI